MMKMTNTSFLFRPTQYFENDAHTVKWLSGGLWPTQFNEAHLGFNSAVYTTNYHKSENVVNIMNINSILVNTDIITGSYVNGRMQPMIYSFFRNVSPGYKIVEKAPHLKYLPVTLDTVANLRTYITDQDGNLLNLRGEVVTIKLDIRQK